MSKFTEHKLEQAFCELLAQEGYPHSLSITLQRQTDDVLIESYKRFMKMLLDGFILKREDRDYFSNNTQ